MKNPANAPATKDPRKRVMDGCHRGWMAGSSSGWNRATWPANPGDTIAYGYNSRSEVTTATATTRTAYDFDYSYDYMSRRVRKVSYDWQSGNWVQQTDQKFVYDGNGNVSEALRVSNGTVEAHYEYDPFGNTTATSGTWASANPYRFSTKWFDGETSLYYYGLRYYTPRLGVWMPIGPPNLPGPSDSCTFSRNSPGQVSERVPVASGFAFRNR